MSHLLEWIEEVLSRRAEDHLLRDVQITQGLSATEIEINGQRLLNFGSNDYLGLAWRLSPVNKSIAATAGTIDVPSKRRAKRRAKRRGSGASPLITGYTDSHARLEAAIADFKSTEAALVFSSGYAANLGTISALCRADDVIFSDALNHASIIDGCRLARSKIEVYRHNDLDDLRTKLESYSQVKHIRKYIVTDSVFSMDGDTACLEGLVDLADQYQATLVVDEAHAAGVYGRTGAGLVEELGLEQRVPVRIGTLSKAVGSVGGFVAGSRNLIAYLRNFARPYIYSTSMPAWVADWSREAIEWIPDLSSDRQRLRKLGTELRQRLIESGCKTRPGDSPIIPVIVESSESALNLSRKLYELGFYVPAIRPPTVPQDQSMLRISINCCHTDAQIGKLFDVIKKACSEQLAKR